MDDILAPLPPRRGPYPRGAKRDAAAVRLRSLGWSLPEIAEYLGIDGNGNGEVRVAAAIRRALANTSRFARDETKIIEVQGLDELERALWMQLRAHHVLVSNGRLITDENGVPLNDDRFILECIDRILKVKEQRAKLLGLFAPARAEVITIDSVDQEIAKLEAELRQHRQQG